MDADGDEPDPMSVERGKVTNLIRWLAVFVAIPTVSIGLVLYMYDPVTHGLHMVGFLILGAIAMVVLFAAPQLAERFIPKQG